MPAPTHPTPLASSPRRRAPLPFRAAFLLLSALAPLAIGATDCTAPAGAPQVGDLCGGLDANPCGEGLYCDFAADVGADEASGMGRCTESPEPGACTLQYDPVCGLDGRTYGNACLASAFGVTVASPGECVPDVTGCPEIYAPVCGDDGRTYGNRCEADAASVTVVSEGECMGVACPGPAPLAPNELCDDGTVGGPICACDETGCHWEVRTCPTTTHCGGLLGLTCAQGEFCDYAIGDLCGAADALGTCRPIPTFCTFEYAPVCGCDGNTYSNPCMAAGNGVGVSSYGACGGSGSTCAPSDCGAPPASPFPLECLPDASGACTWQEACLPPPCAAPPMGCHYEGYTQCTCGTLVCDPPPGGVCGGLLGAVCGAGEFCDFDPSTSCGSGDQQGTCSPIPEACTDDYTPVCGCDGKTYSNACGAAANGVSVASTGECASTVCDPQACGPAPLSPLPYECLPDANGTCTWQVGCFPPACAAPRPGCRYEGGTTCTCGTLVCDQCALVDCLPPDPTCETVPDGTCCGTMTCP